MSNDFCYKSCKCKEFKIDYNTFTDNIIPYNHIVITCNKCEKLFIINCDQNSIDDYGTGILDIKKDWEKNK